ncbi:ankyrin repeat protein [Mycena floridula]|nr:ankyrin repeat protein [Mycena floridula]
MQTPEAEAFLNRILALPNGPGVTKQLQEALQPSLDDETELRKLWAQDRSHARVNASPFVGLVDVFAAPVDIRITRARVINPDIEDDLQAKYTMPISESNRRNEGTPSTVLDMEEFKKNWAIFSEGSLSQLFDWNNVVAAGGSVLACLTPLSAKDQVSKRAIRKFYHSEAYPTSDVDLFLWGMTPEQAEKKIVTIYEAVRDSVPWDVTCVRTKHTVSIHSQYPYRSVQIVLRLYSSPAEILAGFDVDAPSCCYDGSRVWANPRCIVAMMQQCNTVDMSRRSPSYEVRLGKYSTRGFEIYDPTLDRGNVDPTIYERSIARIEGLARLLVLEKLKDADSRYWFLESRRTLRGRPGGAPRYDRRKKYKGDLKADMTMGVEMNDYDVASLHIPYGPGWDARRIDKLVYQTDLGMNSTFNPKNKGRRLHRHPAFFGTISECIEDCCEYCPDPIDEDERKLQAEEDDAYIRGRISFIQEDPGRQTMSGSFNPIDVGEWTAQAYIGPTEKLFSAIAAHDRASVASLIQDGIDVNIRDHVGRTCLHLAILVRASDIACDLIEAGCRITARLVDGRGPIHLAAQKDLVDVVKKIIERNALNAEQAGKEDDTDSVHGDTVERPSSEDDWSSQDDGVISLDEDDEGDDEDDEQGEDKDDDGEEKKKEPTAAEMAADVGEIPDDEENTPDILDINIADWDFALTPLAYAILFASPSMVDTLLAGGADANLVPKATSTSNPPTFHPLFLTLKACKVAERLIAGGAVSSYADDNANRVELVKTFLRVDPNAQVVLDFPSINDFSWNSITFPVTSALQNRGYAMLFTLLAYGAKLNFTEEDIGKALANSKQRTYYNNDTLSHTVPPVETALASFDDILRVLLDLGAEVNLGIKQAIERYANKEFKRSILQWVRFAIYKCDSRLAEDQVVKPATVEETTPLSLWKAHIFQVGQELDDKSPLSLSRRTEKELEKEKQEKAEKTRKLNIIREYLVEAEKLLLAKRAKLWKEIYPTDESTAPENPVFQSPANTISATAELTPSTLRYELLEKNRHYNATVVAPHLARLYDELFDACFEGKNAKVQSLCLPAEGSEATPLQIAAQVANPSNQWIKTGHTPLYAAFVGGHWETVKLVVSICIAQYRPSEDDKKFNVNGLKFDDDDSDYDSDESDDTIDGPEINFIDVAKRPSSVQCDWSPKLLLDTVFSWSLEAKEGQPSRATGSIIDKAICDNNLEAFIKVANLYKLIDEPIQLGTKVLDKILQWDRPDMLHEYIVRTGGGILAPRETLSESDDDLRNVDDKHRVYLGLSVHGKKRKDLAAKNDPDAVQSQETSFTFLLWRAASSKALNIIEYLSSERPLAAYQAYISSNVELHAQKLKRIVNFDTLLPQLLGWTVTPMGESPLTAAALSGDLAVAKKMFPKASKLLGSSMHDCIKFVGYNTLMVAIARLAAYSSPDLDLSIVGFLLGKGFSPALNDQSRGWNIFHIICNGSNINLLKYLLKKLPRDVVETLLAQQSKGHMNTPLNIAVKLGRKKAIKLILDFCKPSLLQRDRKGFIPLHWAVQKGHAKIVKILIEASPSETVFIENGVGDTTFEMAVLQELKRRTQNQSHNRRNQEVSLPPNEVPTSIERIDLKHLAAELPKLRSTITELVEQGKLEKESTLVTAFSSFASEMEEKLRQVEAKVEDSEEPPVHDKVDVEKTLQIILDATLGKDGPGCRQLVHLIDVQKSVQGDLGGSGEEEKDQYSYQYSSRRRREVDIEGGLEPEQDSEVAEKSGLLVAKVLGYHSIFSSGDTV